jgi:hypothetical protein
MDINATTLYYLFSATAQTFGAIVGLIGMLTVYRLQQLSTYPNTMVADIDDILAMLLDSGSKREIREPNFIRKKLVWFLENSNSPITLEQEKRDRLYQFVRSLDKIPTVSNGTKDRFILFLIANLSLIFLSLVLVPFCEILAGSGSKYFWIIILMTLVIASLASTMRLSMMLIETQWVEFWKRTRENIKEHNDRWTKGAARKFL